MLETAASLSPLLSPEPELAAAAAAVAIESDSDDDFELDIEWLSVMQFPDDPDFFDPRDLAFLP
jgi:hypothetical protein